ncbi:Glycogen debranching enzyme (alpha-1,6-glucosidase) [Halogeometricum limi]|uniref:Glycogen debranching enzyme (Alpha-1,6-glucosidase) n=2 Tax=Halogeometricum limi TaxID=555875 RepID=A0A1I6I9R9_9EURY|nr:Glycogen debranching enzyme (alpha-1,6-glucosidase) [Halogeometricum limi]
MPLETLVDGYSFFVGTDATTLGPEGGLYHRDTRHLSSLAVDVVGATVTPIGETLDAANARTVTLATAGPSVNEMHDQNVPKHTELVVERRQSVHEGAGYAETVALSNHSASPTSLTVRVRFAVDFADLFEVRGFGSDVDRTVRTSVGDRSVTFRYDFETADGERVSRTSLVSFAAIPDDLSSTTATFSLRVGPQETAELPFAVRVGESGESAEASGASLPTRTPPVSIPAVETGDPQYDAVFERAAADLTALTTETPQGPVPLAGTPWFVTPFGRDALLTAHQTVGVAPELVEGTLRYFAAHRGRDDVASTGEQPGKLFHEIRHGELAARNRVPHTPYFGTVDATPLWVTLLAEACRWRGDDSLATELADALADALAWILRTSDDTTDDPFLYYGDDGVLDHNAWKDTADSVRFADGTVADRPLALAEVQGYAASALDEGATLLERLAAAEGVETETEHPLSTYRDRAAAIERAFDEEFWLPERSFYGLAKQGDGRIVDAVTSNVGHCLWTGTIPESRADSVASTFADGPLSSGWGVRTMSPDDAGYSPVSYHAGGVWPHDTSLVALGLSRYGYGDAAERLATDVLDATAHLAHDRLPELYCGFGDDRAPVEYPAACTPQAWAAGAPFAFLRASFDVSADGDGVSAGRTPARFAPRAVDVFGAVRS